VLLAVVFGVVTLGSLAWLSIGAGILAMLVLTFAYLVFTSYLAPIIVSYVIGHVILVRVQADWARNRFVMFVLGLVLLTVLAFIPGVNVIVGILVAVFALGALLLWLVPLLSRPAPTVQPAAT